MKKTVRQYLVLSLLLAVSLLSLVAPLSYAAANHSIYITQNSGSYQPGNSFTLIVNGYAAPTQFGAGQVSGTLTFPANLLRVTSVSTTGNPYQANVSATPNNTAGTVTFNGQNYFGGPNDQTIFIMSVTFQALANGTANVGFSSATKFTSSYSTTPTTLSGGSYTISTPAPPTCPAGQTGTPPNCTTPPPASCPSGQVGTPPNCTTPKPNNPTPTPVTPSNPKAVSPDIDPNIPTAAPAAITPTVVDAGDLSIKDVTAKVSLKENTITWKTTRPNVTSEIQLGTSKQKLTAKPSVTKVSDGDFSATATNLVPGTRYYYTITAVSTENAEKKATYSGAFTTRGYPVKILVTQNGKPAANTKVQIEQDSYITDKSGTLKLELASQDYSVVVTLADKTTKSFNFTVAKKTFAAGKTPDTQTFTFDTTPKAAATATSSSPIGLIIAASVGGLLVTGGVLFLLARRRKNTESQASSYDVDAGQYNEVAAQPPIQSPYNINPEEQQYSAVSAIEQQYIQQPEAIVPSLVPEPAAIYEQQMAVAEQVPAQTVAYETPIPEQGYAPVLQTPEQYSDTVPTEQYTEQVVYETPVEGNVAETTTSEVVQEVYPTQPDPEPESAAVADEEPEITQYIEHSGGVQSIESQQPGYDEPPLKQPADVAAEETQYPTPPPASDQYMQGRPAV